MNLWHLTPDADRDPRRVTPGIPVRLSIGTWPLEPGQQVAVDYSVASAGGETTSGTVRASWMANRGENSYWSATLGPFADGDRVAYWITLSSRGERVVSDRVAFTVQPLVHLALLWHHHQPLYRDLTAPPPGAYRYPWVRLHALRDYFGMAHLVGQHPDIHVTINFSPILLWQAEDYLDGGGSDRALVLTRTSTDRLTSDERREIVETFFDADWHHQIYPHPRYRGLLEQRARHTSFSDRDITDLKMWSTLAWFAVEFRSGTVLLPDGRRASVQRFVEKGEGFTRDDVEAMLDEQAAIMRNIVPLHRRLQEQGQLEVSVSPYAHPIAPLLIDTDLATLDRPGTTLPPRFAHPDDAEGQIAAALAFYRDRFGRSARGMWPPEGAVGEHLLPLLVRQGVRWIATDEGVLARSGRYGYRVDDPGVLCQPYRALTAEGDDGLSVLFRHRRLSDAIGFEYAHEDDPQRAAASFVAAVKDLAAGFRGDRDHVLPIILDGENAWGSYRDDGRPFLHALYERLTREEAIKTVTVSEYLDGNGSRRVPPHPPSSQTRVYNLFTGSWADEFDSAPGVDLGTWIGEPHENTAWQLLGTVRSALENAGHEARSVPAAFHALYAAEGSDWFWWFGSDHQSDADEGFDALFRTHLRAACEMAGVKAPVDLSRHIVPHRLTWTFTAPVDIIQAGDELVVRTNCPGRLSWTVDGGGTPREEALAPVGGVMAGACRYAIILGPFPAGTVVRFRFRCQHEGCPGTGPCCRGDEHVVSVTGLD